MIHARKDYDRIQDPSGKIPRDEPVFLLRGQDVFAPELLDQWALKHEQRTGNSEMAVMVRTHAQKMRDWQKTVKVKTADLPVPFGFKLEMSEEDIPEEINQKIREFAIAMGKHLGYDRLQTAVYAIGDVLAEHQSSRSEPSARFDGNYEHQGAH